MINSRRRLAAAFAITLAASAVGIGAASAVDDTKEIRQSDFISGLSDTRSAGSYDFLEEGLIIQTKDASGQAKVAEYYAPRTAGALPASGSYTWHGTPGSPDSPLGQPGAQIVFDTDAVAGNPGSYNVLVGEQVYSDNAPGADLTDWWYTGGNAKATTNGITCPSTTGGSGTDCHGTLAEWKTAVPDAKLTALGFSMGSGVKGDGVLREQKFGADQYIFTNEATTAPAQGSVDPAGTTSVTQHGRMTRYDMSTAAIPAGSDQGTLPKFKVTVNNGKRDMQTPAAGTTGQYWYYCPPRYKCVIKVFTDGVENTDQRVTVNK